MKNARQNRRWKRSCSRIGTARRGCVQFYDGSWSAWTWARRVSSITSQYASVTARLSIISSVAAASAIRTAFSRFSVASLTSRIRGRHGSMAPDSRVIMVGERNALRAFDTAFRRDRPIVFDIGANVGDYIGEVLRHFPAAHVYAFEPQPEAAVELEDRFPWIQIERFVVGDV